LSYPRRRPSERFLRYLPALILLAATALPFYRTYELRRSLEAPLRITRVIDGDTVDLGFGRRARYLGIDAPETERKTSAGWQKVHEPFGEEAAMRNRELVEGRPVRIEYDTKKEDRFGRKLIFCFVREGGREVLVQEELLREGLVYLYVIPPNVKYVDRLVKAMKEAQHLGLGIWATDLSIPAQDAGNFIGQRKLITGRLGPARTTAKTIIFNCEGLNVVIFKNELDLFLENGVRPQDQYAGKKVRLYGLIKTYQGAPEVIVSNPWQLEVV